MKKNHKKLFSLLLVLLMTFSLLPSSFMRNPKVVQADDSGTTVDEEDSKDDNKDDNKDENKGDTDSNDSDTTVDKEDNKPKEEGDTDPDESGTTGDENAPPRTGRT